MIVHSELLLEYLMENYPELYFVSSTTKVLTDFPQLAREAARRGFPLCRAGFPAEQGFRPAGRAARRLQKEKLEFLCNECCWFGCRDRRACYEAVSRRESGRGAVRTHRCAAPDAADGLSLFQSHGQSSLHRRQTILRSIYLPMGFSNFKIEGRGASAAP